MTTSPELGGVGIEGLRRRVSLGVGDDLAAVGFHSDGSD